MAYLMPNSNPQAPIFYLPTELIRLILEKCTSRERVLFFESLLPRQKAYYFDTFKALILKRCTSRDILLFFKGLPPFQKRYYFELFVNSNFSKLFKMWLCCLNEREINLLQNTEYFTLGRYQDSWWLREASIAAYINKQNVCNTFFEYFDRLSPEEQGIVTNKMRDVCWQLGINVNATCFERVGNVICKWLKLR